MSAPTSMHDPQMMLSASIRLRVPNQGVNAYRARNPTATTMHTVIATTGVWYRSLTYPSLWGAMRSSAHASMLRSTYASSRGTQKKGHRIMVPATMTVITGLLASRLASKVNHGVAGVDGVTALSVLDATAPWKSVPKTRSDSSATTMRSTHAPPSAAKMPTIWLRVTRFISPPMPID